MERPSWDEYFMEMAVLTAKRSTCMRRQVGAVIVKDKHIIATGYNGAPRGIAHCEERGGCLRQKMNIPSGERHELCMALHAEQNAIIQAATLGQSIEGATIYVTHQPCVICAKMLINAGMNRIVVKEGYPDSLAVEMLEEAGLSIIMLEQEDK
ncbi:MAG: cytidine/deoxycytidylate deaminase family protein [Anaerovorax sp.]|nr:cytidine/deoxycytidylate deaminase family protein [Anaerovorax sp.]